MTLNNHDPYVSGQIDAYCEEIAFVHDQLDLLLPSNPRRHALRERIEELAAKIDRLTIPATPADIFGKENHAPHLDLAA